MKSILKPILFLALSASASAQSWPLFSTGPQDQTITDGPKVFSSVNVTSLVAVSSSPDLPAAYVTNTAGGPGLIVDCNGTGTANSLVITTCALASGDNVYIIDRSGSVIMAGIIHSGDSNGNATGISIDPNNRQLVGTDGMPRLTWSGSGVTINTILSLPPRNAPENPQRGDIYYDNATNTLRVYNGTVWKTITTN